MVSLLVADDVEVESKDVVRWPSLLSRIVDTSHSKVALLIDDVDALELLAPSSSSARSFMSSLLLELYNHVSAIQQHT